MSGGRGVGEKPSFWLSSRADGGAVRDGDTRGGETDGGVGGRVDLKLFCRHIPPAVSGPLALLWLTPQTWKHAL